MANDKLATINEKPLALAEMSVPQLTKTAKMLDEYQARIESMSGICSTMRGLVFLAAKEKLGHGNFVPWLRSHFEKTRKTSAEDMRVARGFLKCNPRLHFESLGRELAKKARSGPELDLTNPLVAKVSEWVRGRHRYQLLLEFPARQGGNQYERDGTKGARHHFTIEEKMMFLESKGSHCANELAVVHQAKAYRFLKDAGLDLLIDAGERVVAEARAWRKLTKKEREEVCLEEVADHFRSLAKAS